LHGFVRLQLWHIVSFFRLFGLDRRDTRTRRRR
jgi:hypothetical protein